MSEHLAPNPPEPVQPGPILARDPRVKFLVLAVALLTVLLGFAGFALLDQYDRLSSTQTVNHANRLQDQARTDEEIRQIACINISQVNPNSPKLRLTPNQKRLVREYRAKYDCPPYSKHRAEHPFAPLPKPKPSQQATTEPTAPAQAAPHTTPSPRRPVSSHAHPSSHPSHPRSTHPAPPTSSSARPSSSPAPPAPSPTCLVHLGGVKVCLPSLGL